tara:strand:- start:5 stop:211 length:207 start_codon:yes stop_codon:yes gene_type:complete
MNGFRLSMGNPLRAVECPADIVDQIGGWATEGVGQSYGSEYGLEVCYKWIKKMEEINLVITLSITILK